MPTNYFDGGYQVYVGTSDILTQLRNRIDLSSQRAVTPFDLIVRMEQAGDDSYDITVRIGSGVPANNEPAAAAVDAGPTFGENGVEYEFESTTTDPDADELYYQWDWGDGRDLSEWMGPYASGETCTASHFWPEGDFDIKVRAKDAWGVETEWSAAYSIHLQCCVVRGNVDDDPSGEIDISDLVYLVDYMFIGGDQPPCPDAANVDGDITGDIDISDLVYLVDYMFVGGPVPPSCVR